MQPAHRLPLPPATVAFIRHYRPPGTKQYPLPKQPSSYELTLAQGLPAPCTSPALAPGHHRPHAPLQDANISAPTALIVPSDIGTRTICITQDARPCYLPPSPSLTPDHCQAQNKPAPQTPIIVHSHIRTGNTCTPRIPCPLPLMAMSAPSPFDGDKLKAKDSCFQRASRRKPLASGPRWRLRPILTDTRCSGKNGPSTCSSTLRAHSWPTSAWARVAESGKPS